MDLELPDDIDQSLVGDDGQATFNKVYQAYTEAQGQPFNLPDDFPDDFRTDDPAEAITKLMGGYNEATQRVDGLREKLSKNGTPPESVDAYNYEPDEGLKTFFPDLGDDKIFSAAKEAALKHSIPAETFNGFVGELFKTAAENDLLVAPIDKMAEVKAYGEATKLAGEELAKDFENNESFARGLASQLKGISDEHKPAVEAALMMLSDTAPGQLALRALQSRMNDAGIRVSGEGTNTDGELTKEDLVALDGDPRIDPANKLSTNPETRYDPVLREKYQAAYKKHFSKPNG